MNAKKLEQLLAAARKEPPPEPPAEFAADVLRAVRREPLARRVEAITFGEQLNGLFSRAVLAAAAVMVLCVATDFGLTAAGWPEPADNLMQMASQSWFTPEDF
jgi:hypothetical protein